MAAFRPVSRDRLRATRLVLGQKTGAMVLISTRLVLLLEAVTLLTSLSFFPVPALDLVLESTRYKESLDRCCCHMLNFLHTAQQFSPQVLALLHALVPMTVCILNAEGLVKICASRAG